MARDFRGSDVSRDRATTEGTTGTKHSVSLLALEVQGRATWGPPKPDAGPPVKLISVGTNLAPQDPQIKPDFIDAPSPPNCYAYMWKGGSAPNRTAGDAGKLTFKGHDEVSYVDGDAPGAPQKLPATIECTRKPVGTSKLFEYDCGLPRTPLLVGASWLTDTTQLEVGATGGADIPAFAEKGLAVAPAVKAKAPFDLNQIDPAGTVKVEWEPVTAQLIVITMKAALKDNSEFAEIICTAVAAAGSKTIPSGALALIPKPTATAPLILRTAIVAVSPKGAGTTWGSYLIGVGRGSFGVSCRTPAGQCP